jgi:hypothetical protein
MVVGEGAELEVMPHAVVRELVLGAADEIAGKQSEDDVVATMKSGEQLGNTGKEAALDLWEELRKMTEIVFEDFECFLFALIVFPEELPGDERIGASGDLDVAEIVFGAEEIANGKLEGAFAAATRGEECAVDIEKEQSLLQGQLGRCWEAERQGALVLRERDWDKRGDDTSRPARSWTHCSDLR